MAEGLIGAHWTHRRLVQNLLIASGKDDVEARNLDELEPEELLQAVRGTRFIKLVESAEAGCHCQLCNKPITRFAFLESMKQVPIKSGYDCYDKLCRIPELKKVASLPTRGTHGRETKRYWRELRDGLPGKPTNETIVGWLKEELESGRMDLASEEARVVREISLSHNNLPANKQDADLVVAYCKAHRKFPIGLLVEGIALFRHRGLLPRGLAINEAKSFKEWFRKIYKRGRKLDTKLARTQARRRREAEERRQIQQEVRARKEYWADCRRVVSEKLAECRQTISLAKSEGASEAEIVSMCLTFGKLRKRVEQLCPEVFSGSRMEMGCAKDPALCKMAEWLERNVWFTTRPEIIFFSEQLSFVGRWRGSRSYALLQRDGRWVYQKVHRYSRKGISLRAGLYEARVIEEEWPSGTKVLLERRLDSKDRVVEVEFKEPSRQKPGTYVGFHRNKVVLTSKPVTRPGTHLVFLMNDEGRYHRAWII